MAPLASKQEEKRMESWVPSQSAISRSRRRWGVWVPQMKRTELRPKPQSFSAWAAASMMEGSSARPR